MANDMDTNKQQGGQQGQQSGQQGQKSGQTGQQQQGNVDPNKKGAQQGDDKDDQKQGRTS